MTRFAPAIRLDGESAAAAGLRALRGLLFRLRFWLPVCALILAATLAVIDTWDEFSATWDEPAHIAGGMELLDNGTYDYEPLHPPFGRAATALGPRLAGVRYAGEADIWREGQNLLYEQGEYRRTLTLARAGVLPFFVLAALMTGLMARALFGMGAGIGATALFATTPVMLGLGGLAITDVTVTAFYLAAVLAFLRWLDSRRNADAALLGLTAGLAIMSKYSAIPWLAVSFLAVLLLRRAFGGESPLALFRTRRDRLGVEIAVLALLATIWAAHGFLFTTGEPARPPAEQAAGQITAGGDEAAEARKGGMPIPLFLKSVPSGVASVLGHNARGKPSYFLGQWRERAHPLFFPVTLGVKLPLPLLLLGLAGLALTVWSGLRERRWPLLVPVACFALILGLGMISNLNYGLRHVLPLVPLLCVLAAGGAAIALTQLSAYGRMARPGAACVLSALFLWQAAGAVRAHPDHLAWFNALAGDRPEQIVVLGDLDWGQDMYRLARELERLKVERFHLLYIGSGLPDRHGLPPFTPFDPRQGPVSGWIVTHPRAAILFPEELRWLNDHEPVARAGKTFRIYHVPPENAEEPRP